MFSGLFPRLFSQFREGGVFHGQWSIAATGAPTKVNVPAARTHNDVNIARSGVGVYNLTFPPCAHAFFQFQVDLAAGSVLTAGNVPAVTAINPGAGTAVLTWRKTATDNNATEVANGDTIRMFAYLGQSQL